MLTKQEFIKYMNAIFDYQKQTEKFSDALTEVCDNPGIVISLGGNLLMNYIDLLEVLMNDEKSHTISWWLYEAPENNKHIYETDVTGKEKMYEINTVEDLYDYLCHYQR